MYRIAIIPGDGIGKEVMESGEYLLDKLDLNFSFEYGEAGFECYNKNGVTLPEETIKIAKKSDATLFGASTSTPGQPSPIINLRKELDVYAKELDRTRTYLIEKTVSNYFDTLDEMISDKRIDDIKAGKSEMFTLKDVAIQLGLK